MLPYPYVGIDILRRVKYYKTVTKQEKVELINQAIKRSPVARAKSAKAEILKDGRLEYTMLGKTASGREYRMKVSFSKILGLLHGEDMRRLHRLFSR